MSRFKMDWGLVVVTLALAGFSLSLIWSANPSYLIPQVIFFLVGFALFFIISQIDSEILHGLAIPLYFLSLAFLIITLLNAEIRGASRWIDVLGFRLQPSEIVKPFMIISFAYFMTESKMSNFLSLIKLIAAFFVPLIVIFFQPDLGNVIVYFFFLCAMFFANRLDIKIILGTLLIGITGSPLLWGLLHDYQRNRILSFLSPENDPQGTGYNAMQAMIAVGSGRLFGLGLGRGTQSHLRFLPENHTDFIFASLVEELGLFGAFLLLIFYGFIFIKILKLAIYTENKFNYLIVIGIFTQLLSQVFINISMNMGMVPITGVTLPLVSSGGSSIIATFIALGIIASLEKDQKRESLVIR